MDVEPVATEDASSSSGNEPHLMRVSDHHKDKALVGFAIKFLQENPTRPLVLQTCQVESSPPVKEGQGFDKCTKAISKLVTVVEIIKRELPTALRTAGLANEEARKPGELHQYNEVLCLEDEHPASEAPDEQVDNSGARLQLALGGKNHRKVKRTPYMKITLSRIPVLSLLESTATYQAPIVWKPNKAQKAREKKRSAKAAGSTAADKPDEEMASAPGPEPQAASEVPKGTIGTIEL